MKKHIAVDLGATSGRVIVGNLKSFEEVHRFQTPNCAVLGEFYWDAHGIYIEILQGLKKCFDKYGDDIISIGIDTWGVDYGLLDESGALVSPIYHYRDSRTLPVMDKVIEIAGGRESLYKQSGLSIQSYNTIFQLYAHKCNRPKDFEAASHYLSFPDLLNYWLTGVMCNELTHASTTQLLNPHTNDWNWDLIAQLGFNVELFGKIVPSGAIVGPLTEDLQKQLGASADVVVVASAAHDTASAVVAVPAVDEEYPLFLSSGTWSILGVGSKDPILTAQALDEGFSNEKGFNGETLFLQNIVGMWIQTECVNYWKSLGQNVSWKELDLQTLEDKTFNSYINPLDERFMAPNTHDNLMTDRIVNYCKETNQKVPQTQGQFMRAIYRGLAITYAKAVKDLESIVGRTFDSIYIIGGGCKNEILDEWTAQETGLCVYAGPSEATSLGNILTQALACGVVSSLSEGHKLIQKSQNVKVFQP